MALSIVIAADVGNARMKLGLFGSDCPEGLPDPESTLHLADDAPDFDRLSTWLDESVHRPLPTVHRPPASWHIASVNRPAASRLVDWLREHRPEDGVTLLAAGDLPLEVKLERPDMVGIDRLLDAVAANRLREPHRSAVLVDVGSAITVDLVSTDGAFMGGAILPGIAMSARALYEFTDLLPLIDMSELVESPPALGTATVAAMRSGLFWGAVGAIRELVERLTGGAEADVFLTGGAAPAVAQLLGPAARYIPHLTLAGITLAASAATRRAGL
jgi:type III pantothenate kinase